MLSKIFTANNFYNITSAIDTLILGKITGNVNPASYVRWTATMSKFLASPKGAQFLIEYQLLMMRNPRVSKTLNVLPLLFGGFGIIPNSIEAMLGKTIPDTIIPNLEKKNVINSALSFAQKVGAAVGITDQKTGNVEQVLGASGRGEAAVYDGKIVTNLAKLIIGEIKTKISGGKLHTKEQSPLLNESDRPDDWKSVDFSITPVDLKRDKVNLFTIQNPRDKDFKLSRTVIVSKDGKEEKETEATSYYKTYVDSNAKTFGDDPLWNTKLNMKKHGVLSNEIALEFPIKIYRFTQDINAVNEYASVYPMISGLSENFSISISSEKPSFSRIQPIFHYNGTSRGFNIGTVALIPSEPAEFERIYQMVEWLTKTLAYSPNISQAHLRQPPLIRLTVGDIFHKVPAIITGKVGIEYNFKDGFFSLDENKRLVQFVNFSGLSFQIIQENEEPSQNSKLWKFEEFDWFTGENGIGSESGKAGKGKTDIYSDDGNDYPLDENGNFDFSEFDNNQWAQYKGDRGL